MICEGAGGTHGGLEYSGAEKDVGIGCRGEQDCMLGAWGDVRNGGERGLGGGDVYDRFRGRGGTAGVGSGLTRFACGD